MYISEITIEGFKSYATRVTLSNFDQAFNAITGLNGSGKSNILDSICFVLGIKNLSQVRASNLQELVYKQGQAGVTKATVSITWHNDDPKTGPAGYEDKEHITITRQVVIGGRNKYLINGHAAQENRVADLFHSVQLNVNNPHFLIMQGRITKVLNMKPPEILSLLEEAAGTRMYEKKKEAAQRTLAKKQAKLEQIDSVLNDDILPSLELLRKQCGQYNEWAQQSSTLERLRRVLVAYDYTECNKKADKVKLEITAMEEAVKAQEEQRARLQAEVEEQAGIIRDLETEKEIQAGGEVKELQKEVDRLSMDLTKDTTTWKARQEALDTETSALASLQAALKELAAQDMDGQVSAAEAARGAAREALAAAEKGVEAAQRELAGAEAGDGRDESNRSLQERLADAQTAQTHADAEAKGAEVRAKHLAKQLAEQKKALAKCDKDAQGAQRELAKQQAGVEEASRQLKALNFSEEGAAEAEAARDTAAAAVRSARDEVQRLSHEVSVCDFRFAHPGGRFDAGKVRGVVAKLVHVKDPSTTLALEVAAGGKLYQVVVDDETTAKELLERGKLTRRVTIIPLNKVQYSQLPGGVVDAATRMSGGKAQPALQLVGSAPEVEAAIKYAFGGTLVCQDAGTAKKLAFSREVGARCVTLEGDDFNPSGLLTGGSRATSRSVLGSLAALADAERALAEAQAALAAADERLRGMAGAAKTHQKLKQEAELAAHALALLQDRLAGSEAAQLAGAVEGLERELGEAQATAAAAGKRKAELVAQAKALEHEIANFAKERGSRIKAAQEKVKKAKAELESAKKVVRAAEQAAVGAIAEREAAAGEAAALEVKAAAAQAAIAGLSREVDGLRAAVANARAAYEAAAGRLETRRARLRECDQEIAGHEKARAKAVRGLEDAELEARKLDKKLKATREDGARYTSHVATLERDFSWVVAERGGFGSGDYEFARMDMKKMSGEYGAVEARVAELKGKVNSKCIDRLEKAEGEYHALVEKRDTVEKDRLSIEGVIAQLDEKKRLAMEETWKKVDRDFGSIFSTLLPGTAARLEPPEGETFEAGLEVRVAFGGVWKESLTELSGGQRSLLALSLILALCRFKPAPLYILDEVDAALDLNHTQNIGRMIKQHFPQSQFVVVSLKEGMFNNANVIFRTKFVDGVSTVTRTVPAREGGAAAGGKAGKGAVVDAAPARAALREANRA